MTGTAIFVSAWMFTRFSLGNGAVVTGSAVTQHFVVIDVAQRRPAAGAMACRAVVGGRGMIAGLAGRGGAIVTGRTGTAYRAVIEAGGRPGAG